MVVCVYLVHVAPYFESVDEILWCNHSNETSLAVLSHGTIYSLAFYKKNFEFLESLFCVFLSVIS